MAKEHQKALFAQGIPLTAFQVDDTEYERLKSLGVAFTIKPTAVGNQIIAVFDDTCGNLIQIFQPDGSA